MVKFLREIFHKLAKASNAHASHRWKLPSREPVFWRQFIDTITNQEIQKHNKRFFSFRSFYLEGIQVVEVLVCHWGEDLTGNGLVKGLSLSTVKESRVIPMEIIMRK